MEKKPFIEFQIMAYELRELYEQGKFTIDAYKDGKKIFVNWLTLEDRTGRNTKEMIKHYKKVNQTKTLGCSLNTRNVIDNHCRLCCVCGNKDILLFRSAE